MSDDLEGLWKDAVFTSMTYCPGICLDELNTFTRQATSSLIVDFLNERFFTEYKFNFILLAHILGEKSYTCSLNDG